MNVTDDVLNDLLTLYLAGEASADTRALIEERARREPAFAAKMHAAREVDRAAAQAIEQPGLATPPSDGELRALKQTRQAIFLRTLFFAGGLVFTLLPLAFLRGVRVLLGVLPDFQADADSAEFLIDGTYSGLVWAFWSIAAACWVACWVMNREVRKAGL
jgi:anti-sigma factor RsiW